MSNTPRSFSDPKKPCVALYRCIPFWGAWGGGIFVQLGWLHGGGVVWRIGSPWRLKSPLAPTDFVTMNGGWPSRSRPAQDFYKFPFTVLAIFPHLLSIERRRFNVRGYWLVSRLSGSRKTVPVPHQSFKKFVNFKKKKMKRKNFHGLFENKYTSILFKNIFLCCLFFLSVFLFLLMEKAASFLGLL